MKNIIITEVHESGFVGPDVEVIDLKSFPTGAPIEWSNYEQEYVPYLICEQIGQLGLSKLNVFINSAISGEDKFLIAAHLLTVTGVAVFFFSREENIEIYRDADYNILKNKAVKIYSKLDLDRIIADTDECERIYQMFTDAFDYTFFVKNFQNSIEYDRHQATNEWAAIKLLLNHGRTLAQTEAIFPFPKTAYFKQKLRNLNISALGAVSVASPILAAQILIQRSLLTSHLTGIRRVLLIDDNADKGWSHFVGELFSGVPVDIKYNYSESSNVADFSIYDMILLDLRLPFDSSSSATDIQHGLSLIDQIKTSEDSLHVPLLIFTASQKAATMEKVLEKGADGIFVKEALDSSAEDSLANYLDLITKINCHIEKGKALSIYWKAIVKIKNNLIAEVSDIPPMQLKSRIVERLEMFYGLLKKNYEQNTYNDQRFHFSSESLAYMTLWSMLNEIQECYFEKGTGLSHTRILDGTGTSVPIPLDDWKIKAQTPDAYLVREKPSFTENIDNLGNRSQTEPSYFKEIFSRITKKQIAPYFLMASKFTKQKYDPRRTLSMQIAYLILNKSQFLGSTRPNDYLGFVKRSNEIRNTLYLTHGEDQNTNFHANLERNKSLPPLAMTQLFTVVSFLLTGDDTLI